MLVLHILIKSDAESQKLALFVKDGFRLESWRALEQAGTVYEGRIVALPHPDYPAGASSPLYSSILLSTTYEGDALTYQHWFWDALAPFFLLVAFAAKNPPFGTQDLSPEQLAAFATARQAIEASENATNADEVAMTQKAFSEATKALAQALARDELAKQRGEIAKTKFERFTEWVNQNDLTYNIGSPDRQDLRIPPQGKARSQFLNPRLPTAPWP